MSTQARTTRIPRHAAQMDPQELSPLTTKRGVVLDKPRRRDTQVSDTALARASAVLNSPHRASSLVSPSSSSSIRQKLHQQLLLQHFAMLDIEMVYDIAAQEEQEAQAIDAAPERRGSYEKDRSDSMDMADIFYSEH